MAALLDLVPEGSDVVDFALKFTLANPDVPGYENARSGQAERGRRNRKTGQISTGTDRYDLSAHLMGNSTEGP
ncbi:MAG: hypothetical protein CME19_20405 [Gemmatimonadetes bacterium]|nr:hypothetical protein [Gemmatimonadota bacterium]